MFNCEILQGAQQVKINTLAHAQRLTDYGPWFDYRALFGKRARAPPPKKENKDRNEKTAKIKFITHLRASGSLVRGLMR